MREAFARSLQEGTEDGLTNGEQIIRTLIQKAKEGDMRAIEYVLDRMGGKPLQAVEVAAEHSFSFLSEAERIRITESVKKIKQMQAKESGARSPVGPTLTLLPAASEYGPKVSAPPGENSKNFSSKPKLQVPIDRPAIGRDSACQHGIAKHQCPICGALGL